MTQPKPEAIRSQLERILQSSKFMASKKLSRFLRFVVEETLADRAAGIKQYTVAVEALGYDPEFDPQSDPAVRIQARRLRRALNTYYDTHGITDPIRIEIPKGIYVPNFQPNSETVPPGQRTASHKAAPHSAGEAVRLNLQTKPSIAVLPFSYMGDNPAEEYLADGISAELTVGLTRFKEYAVIARQSTLRYKNSQASVKEVARDLNVRFLLSGTVSKHGDTIRVTSELAETIDSTLLWAITLQQDLSANGLFKIQDGIARRIVSSISGERGVIPRRLHKEVLDKHPSDLSTYGATLLYHHYNTTFKQDDFNRACQALERAVETDPQEALGWAQLAELCGVSLPSGKG